MFAWQARVRLGALSCNRYDQVMIAMSRIESRMDVLGGKPCVAGTRMPVRDVLAYLAAGDSVDDLVAAFPYLKREDIMACLAYAAALTDQPLVIAAE